MVTTFIELGGVRRPVRFAYEGLLAYEKKTGRSALKDFAAFDSDAPSIEFIVNIAYAGLYAGYRKEKFTVDFDEFSVAEWIGDNQDAMNEIMAVFVDSFPKAEKKQTPRPMKAKAQN